MPFGVFGTTVVPVPGRPLLFSPKARPRVCPPAHTGRPHVLPLLQGEATNCPWNPSCVPSVQHLVCDPPTPRRQGLFPAQGKPGEWRFLAPAASMTAAESWPPRQETSGLVPVSPMAV